MISLNSVYKAYSGNENILKGLNLKCERGYIYTLIGKNGAGKSTLINSMAGLISIDQGNIEIMGNEISRK